MDLLNDLGFSLYTTLPVCYVVTTSDNRKKSKIRVSTDLVCHYWTPGIKFNKSLSLSIIRLVNYSVTTSLIWVLTIEDVQDFSGIVPITLSRGFSVETLTGVTLSWKTKLNGSISIIEDGIPGWFQHCCKVCCKKGGCCGRWALIVSKKCTVEMCFLDE